MSHRPRSKRYTRTPSATFMRAAGKVGNNFSFLLLVIALFLTVGAVGLAASDISRADASGVGGPSTGAVRVGNGPSARTCGAPGQAECPPTGSQWIPLRSSSPADVIAAARQTVLFNVDRSANGDYVKDLSHLGTPVLVHALHAPGGIVMPDCYVIPIHDGTGATMAAAELNLNPAHTAIQVMAIVTYNHPRPHDTIPRVNQAAALSAVAAQHHTSLRVGAQAELAYFPVNAYAQATGKIVWVSGGEFPADPIWLVPGADGQDHIVGADGHVYYLKNLPIATMV